MASLFFSLSLSCLQPKRDLQSFDAGLLNLTMYCITCEKEMCPHSPVSLVLAERNFASGKRWVSHRSTPQVGAWRTRATSYRGTSLISHFRFDMDNTATTTTTTTAMRGTRAKRLATSLSPTTSAARSTPDPRACSPHFAPPFPYRWVSVPSAEPESRPLAAPRRKRERRTRSSSGTLR